MGGKKAAAPAPEAPKAPPTPSPNVNASSSSARAQSAVESYNANREEETNKPTGLAEAAQPRTRKDVAGAVPVAASGGALSSSSVITG